MKQLNVLFLLTMGFPAIGQNVSGKASREYTMIGKPVEITYTCRMGANSVYRFTPEKGALPSRKSISGSQLVSENEEQIEQLLPFHDTVVSSGIEKIWKGTYTVTGWDEGDYVIEDQSILVDDSTIRLPKVYVTFKLVGAKKGQDIYDIEETFAELPEKDNYLIDFIQKFWWFLIVILSIIGYVIFRRWKNGHSKKNSRIVELSLKERTLLAIEMLEKERKWVKGKLKEHFVELSFILRSYLSSRYELNLLENTTAEAQLLLSHKGLHPETIKVIGTVLDQSDMVKFARSALVESEVMKVSQQVRQIIAETSPIEFEHEQ